MLTDFAKQTCFHISTLYLLHKLAYRCRYETTTTLVCFFVFILHALKNDFEYLCFLVKMSNLRKPTPFTISDYCHDLFAVSFSNENKS